MEGATFGLAMASSRVAFRNLHAIHGGRVLKATSSVINLLVTSQTTACDGCTHRRHFEPALIPSRSRAIVVFIIQDQRLTM